MTKMGMTKAEHVASNKLWAELMLAEGAMKKSVASKDVRQAYKAALAKNRSFWAYMDAFYKL